MSLKLSGFPLFTFILLGQSAALLGATVTNFALGIWAYEKAGNVADYTWIAVAATLPGIFLGPILGVYIDRWPRKSTLIISQIGNATVLGIIAALLFAKTLAVWNIVAVVPFGAICAAVLQISFSSTISSMVGKDRLSQANALLGLVFGVVQLAGPLLGGAALDHFTLEHILLATLIAYVIAIFTLLISPIPTPQRHEEIASKSVLGDLREGYLYLSEKPGLMGGLWMFTLIWFSVSIIQVLFVPVVLGFGTRTELGAIQTAGGVGLLVGGILMVAFKGPKRLMVGIALPCIVFSIAFILIPLSRSAQVISVASLLVMAFLPMANAASQTLWQRKTSPQYQGRVFALRNTIMKAAQPLAFISAGFLADHVFEPNLQADGAWAALLGPFWGVGQGRGAALMMSLFGLVSLVFVVIGLLNRNIRRADIDLPDCEPVPAPPPTTAADSAEPPQSARP
ncbi:Major facilitator superfamily MFS_1 [gamma proteobacterium HdN1]|nr:Major facilitator superfamily MFS_1 [gamma proteobacterium HdN1]